MTVETTSNVAVFPGNGVADEFDFSFKVLDADHLIVERRVLATGVVDKTYTQGEYTLAGLGEEAGSVTLTAGALAATYELIVRRIVPATQEADILNQGGFYPTVVEDQLDRMVMAIQQIAEESGRALKVPSGETGGSLGIASERAGLFLAFDGSGDPIFTSGSGADSALRTDLAASTGGALVSTIRAETGAVAMTQAARVKQQHALPGDFGIVGTQVGGAGQNDKTGLAKLTAAGGTLIIPPDFTVRIATTMVDADMTAPFNIIGLSRDTSEVFFDVNGVGLRKTLSNARSQWENLTIRGNLAHANSGGLDLFDNSSRTLSKLNFHSFSQVGIQITQSGNAILDDLRGYDCLTGIRIDPGATASFSTMVRDYYFTGTNGSGGPRASTALRLVGNLINPVVAHPIIEYCLRGIHASDVTQLQVYDPDMEANTRDYYGVDASFDIRGEQSTASTHEVSWTGAFETYKRFLWKSGLRWAASGGASTNTTRTPSAPNAWEPLLLEDAMLSPYLNINPGGAATDSIEIIIPGLYLHTYQVPWATASAVAGWAGVRLLNEGVEIPGSFNDCYVPAVSGAVANCTRSIIVEHAAGDTAQIQYNASSTQLRVAGRLGGNGAAPTSATGATWTVRHLGATSAPTL